VSLFGVAVKGWVRRYRTSIANFLLPCSVARTLTTNLNAASFIPAMTSPSEIPYYNLNLEEDAESPKATKRDDGTRGTSPETLSTGASLGVTSPPADHAYTRLHARDVLKKANDHEQSAARVSFSNNADSCTEEFPLFISVDNLETDDVKTMLLMQMENQKLFALGQEATLERIDETLEHMDGRFDHVDGRIDDLMKLNTDIATSVNAKETRKIKQDLRKCREEIDELKLENSSLRLQKSELLREIKRLEKLNEKNLSKLSIKH
jgi:hypothetical protein